MSEQPPSLKQQIEAVAWALSHIWQTGRAARMREGEIEEMRRRLSAAEEQLKTWQFAQETLR